MEIARYKIENFDRKVILAFGKPKLGLFLDNKRHVHSRPCQMATTLTLEKKVWIL